MAAESGPWKSWSFAPGRPKTNPLEIPSVRFQCQNRCILVETLQTHRVVKACSFQVSLLRTYKKQGFWGFTAPNDEGSGTSWPSDVNTKASRAADSWNLDRPWGDVTREVFLFGLRIYLMLPLVIHECIHMLYISHLTHEELCIIYCNSPRFLLLASSPQNPG